MKEVFVNALEIVGSAQKTLFLTVWLHPLTTVNMEMTPKFEFVLLISNISNNLVFLHIVETHLVPILNT